MFDRRLNSQVVVSGFKCDARLKRRHTEKVWFNANIEQTLYKLHELNTHYNENESTNVCIDHGQQTL